MYKNGFNGVEPKPIAMLIDEESKSNKDSPNQYHESSVKVITEWE